MSILDYRKMMRVFKKYNIGKIPYNTFKQFETDKIDYDELFRDLSSYSKFSLINIDEFIRNDKKIEEQYNKNIIFQYCYILLSKYKFKNRAELTNVFNNLHGLLIENEYKQIDKFLSSLTKMQKNNDDINFIAKKVNVFINDSKYINYIKRALNSEDNLGDLNHSNICETQEVIANTLKMLFVHKGNIDLKDFLINIKSIPVNQYSINLLKQKFENSKIHFFNYMLNYYNNRFFYHGTNSKWLKQCKKTGLNGIRNCDYQHEIIKVINLFERYNVYKVFEGRSRESKGFKYYITDSIDSAVYYAHQSPEYLSRFCANGYCMKLLDNCDYEAFWRRDYKECLNNVQKLCENINMKKNDISTVINLFHVLWKREVKKNQHPIIFIGRMNEINKNKNEFNEIKKNIDNYSFEQLYDIFTTPSKIHNKRFATIESNFLSVVHLPNLYKLYQLKSDDFLKEQYIIYNKKKYYPDIIITNEYYKNIYFILKDIDEVEKVSDTIYFIPKEYEKINGYIDNKFYIQELKYLILTNGKGITDNGRNFLSNSDMNFSNIYEYHQNLANKLISEYNKLSQLQDKVALYEIIANNIFHNFYIMSKTNNLPVLVDWGYKSKLHYDYDCDNYWYKSQAQNHISTIVLDEIIEKIKKIFIM